MLNMLLNMFVDVRGWYPRQRPSMLCVSESDELVDVRLGPGEVDSGGDIEVCLSLVGECLPLFSDRILMNCSF